MFAAMAPSYSESESSSEQCSESTSAQQHSIVRGWIYRGIPVAIAKHPTTKKLAKPRHGLKRARRIILRGDGVRCLWERCLDARRFLIFLGPFPALKAVLLSSFFHDCSHIALRCSLSSPHFSQTPLRHQPTQSPLQMDVS